MQPTNFKSTLSEKMIGLKRNICECSPGFLGANCNVIDVCKKSVMKIFILYMQIGKGNRQNERHSNRGIKTK